ncbi:hypothetical protein AGABI1DRAFT_112542 [Agaricus bisporus var. burnettii JB137-S8]|uniref:Uncharacterized protein n=1 Tax=Agaricus bisporus var. burnettii (strain JB137-S8 / ATCC MYA-4627 / FGSC 10392) TaxID=597362 RepID=K5XZF5_AGABU|nr:uncharacterized protein AGABI1DRAFT_112542 [Agaricus bisporus var. burnettii JB137-S8]EKM80815.1 hypothetical protein AGABI1DRAFT_112542 [Agaricus bisporus var. burnettii JB137-S8]
MPTKGHRAGATQTRSHSRSSSGTRTGANLQITQREGASTKSEKNKKTPHTQEGGKPGFPRTGSTQRLANVKKAPSVSGAAQQKSKANKPNAGFTITQSGDGEEDEDDWVSSSGAQTPNQNESDSDTASDTDTVPRESAVQLQHAQHGHGHQRQQTWTQEPLPRVETARQADFTAVAQSNGVARQKPPIQTPFPTTNADPPVISDRSSQSVQHKRPAMQRHRSSDLSTESNHTLPEPRPGNHSKRLSVTRPPSTHSISSRSDNMRPHPLIRGHSQGFLNPVLKPSPLAPLTVITDQPSSAPDNGFSTSPESIKTAITSPTGYSTDLSQGRRGSVSSIRSVSTLPVQGAGFSSRSQDRIRTLSTKSMNTSTTALSSLSHLPSVTRPSSPQQISFFPPVNPHLNTEAIHPLLPGPYLNNHLTVLARRMPLRESYDRVIQAKLASNR